MGIVVIIIGLIILIMALRASKRKGPSGCANICDAGDFKQVVSSIGYGRLHPYYTGMSIKDIRAILKKENRDTSHFDMMADMGEMFGFFSGIELPLPPCAGVKRVAANLNRSKVVSSFSIELTDFYARRNVAALLTAKFGNPTPSFSEEFTIWRVRHMVISVSQQNNTIYIIDESRE